MRDIISRFTAKKFRVRPSRAHAVVCVGAQNAGTALVDSHECERDRKRRDFPTIFHRLSHSRVLSLSLFLSLYGSLLYMRARWWCTTSIYEIERKHAWLRETEYESACTGGPQTFVAILPFGLIVYTRETETERERERQREKVMKKRLWRATDMAMLRNVRRVCFQRFSHREKPCYNTCGIRRERLVALYLMQAHRNRRRRQQL